MFEAVDIHAAAAGEGADIKRMTTLSVLPVPRHGRDFSLYYREFDCTVPGRNRALAYADYVLADGHARLSRANRDFDQWWTAEESELEFTSWDWACNGEKPESALPGGRHPVDLVAIYREQMLGGAGR